MPQAIIYGSKSRVEIGPQCEIEWRKHNYIYSSRITTFAAELTGLYKQTVFTRGDRCEGHFIQYAVTLTSTG